MADYKFSASYGGMELKSQDTGKTLVFSDIKDEWLYMNGQRGKIRIVGEQHIYEHGYSGYEPIYKFVNEDLEVLSISKIISID